MTKPKTYAEFWDSYVNRKVSELPTGVLPGDEWGNAERWDALFKAMFLAHVPTDVRVALEIGPGAGKYTRRFLDAFPESFVIAADVSTSYLAVLQEACASYIEAKRLAPAVIGPRHDALTLIAEEHGVGELDVVFSMDAMVHVDLQYLAAYWIFAAQRLRQGGKLIMTVADATSRVGFTKLMDDVPIYFAKQGEQTAKFEWLCPELVTKILDRLGFDVVDARPNSERDFCFVATKR